MLGNGSSIRWIEVGYELFAEHGPEGVQVEKMARILNSNKSGFYHYFGEREIYFAELAEYHDQLGKTFAKEMKMLEDFSPGYINLLIKFKTQLYAQMQMKKHKNYRVFHDAYLNVKKRNEKVQMPLWSQFLNIPEYSDVAKDLYDIAGDMIFTRFYINELTNESLMGLFQILKNTVVKLKKMPAKSI